MGQIFSPGDPESFGLWSEESHHPRQGRNMTMWNHPSTATIWLGSAHFWGTATRDGPVWLSPYSYRSSSHISSLQYRHLSTIPRSWQWIPQARCHSLSFSHPQFSVNIWMVFVHHPIISPLFLLALLLALPPINSTQVRSTIRPWQRGFKLALLQSQRIDTANQCYLSHYIMQLSSFGIFWLLSSWLTLRPIDDLWGSIILLEVIYIYIYIYLSIYI